MNFSLAAAVLLLVAFVAENIIVNIVPLLANDMELILTVTLCASLVLFLFSFFKKIK